MGGERKSQNFTSSAYVEKLHHIKNPQRKKESIEQNIAKRFLLDVASTYEHLECASTSS